MTAHVICMGEAMVELSLDTANPDTAQVGFAGDTLNTAIYLKRSAPAMQVDYATKIGMDAFSERMLEMMRDEGLGTAHVLRDPEREPGLYAITTDAMGERSFTYWRSASAARRMLDAPALDMAAMSGADLLYLSAITLAILSPDAREHLLEWVRTYRAGGGRFAFDSNYRPRLWEDLGTAQDCIAAFWQMTDIALPSVDDEQALFGDTDETRVLARLGGWGITRGALKRGDKGPLPLDGTSAPTCPPVSQVVDSTAAGDSFNAGFLAAFLSGQTTTDACAAGHALASKVVQHRGALLPRQNEVSA